MLYHLFSPLSATPISLLVIVPLTHTLIQAAVGVKPLHAVCHWVVLWPIELLGLAPLLPIIYVVRGKVMFPFPCVILFTGHEPPDPPPPPAPSSDHEPPHPSPTMSHLTCSPRPWATWTTPPPWTMSPDPPSPTRDHEPSGRLPGHACQTVYRRRGGGGREAAHLPWCTRTGRKEPPRPSGEITRWKGD